MKNFLILGGLYFVIGLPLDLLFLLFMALTNLFSEINAFYTIGGFFAYCELALSGWFLVLFFRLIFKSVPRIISTVQKEYPHFSIYLHYWGYATYFSLLASLVFVLVEQVITNTDTLTASAAVLLIMWLGILIWGTLTARKIRRIPK